MHALLVPVGEPSGWLENRPLPPPPPPPPYLVTGEMDGVTPISMAPTAAGSRSVA